MGRLDYETETLIPCVTPTLTSNGDAHSGFRDEHGLVPCVTGQAGAEITTGYSPTLNCNHEAPYVAYAIQNATRGKSQNGLGIGADGEPMYTLDQGSQHGVACVTGQITHTLKAEGFDASEDGTGRGTPIVPIAFDTTQITSKANRSNPQPGDPCHPLTAGGHPPAIYGMQVRRLTPRECERLQAFPDDHTLITVRGKPAADGPRYKALGNSMCVNVMAWIGKQIDNTVTFY